MVELKSQKNLFHSKVIFDFLKSPTFKKSLDSSSLAKIQAKIDHYKHFAQGGIQSLEFQERAIADACRKSSGLWCGELWTGSGKSIIAARVALNFLRRGKKVIFICPNRMGIGNMADGIIQKFHRTFEHYKAQYRIGSLDEVTLLDDVHFFTPHAFVRMAREGNALFKKLISEAGVLIVDEAHHFPEDPEEHQIIYGKIEKLASKHFLSGMKKVVTLTATHGRHDGKPVFKKERPDFQITVNEAVQAGWCPEIHGLPVYLDVRAPKATHVGTEISLNLNGKQLLTYLRKVTAMMIMVQKANPGQQFCAFIRTIREARKLQEIWNCEAARFGFKPVALLIGTMPGPERISIKKAIQDHEYVGYITCDVGSESIDIPRMECVHLIRRTKSINRLVQSIGRVLRNHPEKRRALVVDYNLSERKIIRACQGLEAYAKYVQSVAKRLVSGGPLVAIKGTPNADFAGITIGQERAWIERSLDQRSIKEGSVFGRLTVLDELSPKEVVCGCDCGTITIAQRNSLRVGDKKSCGCLLADRTLNAAVPNAIRNLLVNNGKVIIKPGAILGKLTIIRDKGCHEVLCRCECGRKVIRYRNLLLRRAGNKFLSCGCQGHNGKLAKGTVFTKLTVLSDKDADHVKVKCECGKILVRPRGSLTTGNIKSCGCLGLGDPIPKGKRFGKLVVLEDLGALRVLCLCDCGKKKYCRRSNLRARHNSSCGCLAAKALPSFKPGQVFGHWTTLKQVNTRVALCRCSCGIERTVQRKHLFGGNSKSCGCSTQAHPFPKGAKFGHLSVLRDNGIATRGNGGRRIICQCICGKKLEVKAVDLKQKQISCGCKKILIRPIKRGNRFNMLTVIEDQGTTRVHCLCDCGRKTFIRRASLTRGQKSCGCLYTTATRLKAGTRYGEWTILEDVGARQVKARCSCGFVKKNHYRPNLTDGLSKRCQRCGLKKNAERLASRNKANRKVS